MLDRARGGSAAARGDPLSIQRRWLLEICRHCLLDVIDRYLNALSREVARARPVTRLVFALLVTDSSLIALRLTRLIVRVNDARRLHRQSKAADATADKNAITQRLKYVLRKTYRAERIASECDSSSNTPPANNGG